VEIYIPSVADDGKYGIDLYAGGIYPVALYMPNQYMEIGRLADAEGNLTQSFSTFVEVEPKGVVEIDTVYAIAPDVVEVTLKDRLTEIEGEDFSFVVPQLIMDSFTTEFYYGEDFGLDTYEDEDGNTVLVFEFHEEVMNYDATYHREVTDKQIESYEECLYLEVTQGAISANQYGEEVQPLEWAGAGSLAEISQTGLVEDRIVPELMVFDEVEYGGDYEGEDKVIYQNVTVTPAGEEESATMSVVALYFEEYIDIDSVSLDTFTIGGGDYEVVNIAYGNSIEVAAKGSSYYNVVGVFVENADGDDLAGVSVVQNSGIRDLAGNVKTGMATQVQVKQMSR